MFSNVGVLLPVFLLLAPLVLAGLDFTQIGASSHPVGPDRVRA